MKIFTTKLEITRQIYLSSELYMFILQRKTFKQSTGSIVGMITSTRIAVVMVQTSHRQFSPVTLIKKVLNTIQINTSEGTHDISYTQGS